MMCVYLFLILVIISITNCVELPKVFSKFNEKDCILGELIDVDGKLTLQTLLSHQNENDAYQVILNVPQKDMEALVATKVNNNTESPISFINRLASFNKISYSFTLVSKEGPSHKPVFHIRLDLGDEQYTGYGSKIKEAKRMAALAASYNTEYNKPKTIEKKEVDITPTVALNNLAFKLGIKVEYYLNDGNNLRLEDSSHYHVNIKAKNDYLDMLNRTMHNEMRKINIDDDSDSHGPYKIVVFVGEQQYSGFGYTKQGARHDAASNALKALSEQFKDKEEICTGMKCNRDNVKSTISIIYELATKSGVNLDFEIIKETGPAHKKTFTTLCKFGDYSAEGDGLSKKESKSKAVYNLLLKLQTVDDIKPTFNIDNISPKKKNKKKKKKSLLTDVQKLMSNAKESFNAIVQTLYDGFEGSLNNFKQTNNDGNSNKKEKDQENGNFKHQILQLGITTRYTNIYKSQDLHASLISLNTKPPYICLGKGDTLKSAEDVGSFYALKFLKKHNILTSDHHLDTESLNEEMFEYETFEIAEIDTTD